MELDWTTVAFELVNFGVLALLLTRFLFKPVRKVLRERKQALAQVQAEAETARAQGQAAKAEFERRQGELEQQADALHEQAKQAGEQAARQIIEDGREHVREARRALEAELERARVDAIHRLRRELVELVYEAGRRMLEDMHAGELAVAFARQGAHSLRETLEPVPGPRPRIHARVSPDAELYAVSMVLEKTLGDADIELAVDPALIGGVTLTADNIEIEASAGASIARWLHERLPPMSEPEAAP